MKAVYEKVNFQSGSSITAFSVESDRFDAPWHFHPEIELTYVVESRGMRYVGNNLSDFHPGDLILLGSNLPHCWINEEPNTAPSKAIVIQWHAELFHTIPEFEEIRQLLLKANRGLKLSPRDPEGILQSLSKIAQLKPLQRLLALSHVLFELATNATASQLAGDSYDSDLSSTTNSRIEIIQQYVRAHYTTKIKLADISNQLNMTEQAFSRFFSKVMNRPFFVFLNEYRCNIASRLLLETDLQVTEIAFKCGYESLPFFYQQFRKFKEHSPREFRKMYRKLV